MFGIDTKIVMHKIPLIERSKLVKQNKRRIHPNMLIKVKTKIKKIVGCSSRGYLLSSMGDRCDRGP